MGIIIILAIIFIAALIFGPQFWVKRVIKQHSQFRSDIPGTGGELATHLVEHYDLHGVGVEETDQGDHYDPESRTVRLSKDNFHGYSISAVAIAAHEVGHAIQHTSGERLLALRQSLAKLLIWTDRFAFIFFSVAPLLALVARSPIVFFLMSAFGVGLMVFERRRLTRRTICFKSCCYDLCGCGFNESSQYYPLHAVWTLDEEYDD